jgi:hypothetical protein
MEVTGYCECKKCCGWERNWYGRPIYAYGSLKGKRKKVGYTSTGVKAGKGTIAADPKRYRMGTPLKEIVSICFSSRTKRLCAGAEKK